MAETQFRIGRLRLGRRVRGYRIRSTDFLLAQQAVNVLCAHLRTPGVPPPTNAPTLVAETITSRLGRRPAEHRGRDVVSEYRYQPNDEQVRETIVNTIASHLRDGTSGQRWSHLAFDFTGAHFYTAVWFFDAHFHTNAKFDAAQFHADAMFDDTYFDAKVGFSKAEFHDNAVFRGAHFYSYTLFTETRFHVVAEFTEAHFHGHVEFAEAHFCARAGSFRACFCARAVFSKAHFHAAAQFDAAQFYGRAAFGKSRFYASAVIAREQFHGGVVFDGAMTLSAQIPMGRTSRLNDILEQRVVLIEKPILDLSSTRDHVAMQPAQHHRVLRQQCFDRRLRIVV